MAGKHRGLLTPQMTHAFILCAETVTGEEWTTVTNEAARIPSALEPAPPILSVTVHEWIMSAPVNDTNFFTRFPIWRKKGEWPWRT